MLQFIILGFLIKCDLNGYAIKKTMSLSTVNFVDTSFGSIYPALKKLNQKGHITAREIVEQGKIKKMYSITPEGKEAFLKWLEIPINPTVTKLEYMARIFFYQNLEKEKAYALIEKFVADIKHLKNELEGTKDYVDEISDYYEMSVYRVGNAYYDFLIDWYEKFLVELKEKNE